MNILEFAAVVWVASLLAGFLGSLTGLGGGIILTPVLTLALGVDIRYAIGATLVSVIATSSGAAAAYVREGFSSIRIGMFLEIATTLGAIAGALLAAARISTGALRLFSESFYSIRRMRPLDRAATERTSGRWTLWLPVCEERDLPHP